MDQNQVTVVIGIAGILGTLFSSLIGYSFAWKERKADYRKFIFKEQYELLKQLMSIVGKSKNYVIILGDEKSDFRDQAYEDTLSLIKDFSELVNEGATILPTELWVEYSKTQSLIGTLIEIYEKKKNIEKKMIESYFAQITKQALITRSILGVDELSSESTKLFLKRNSLKKLTDLKIDELKIRNG